MSLDAPSFRQPQLSPSSNSTTPSHSPPHLLNNPGPPSFQPKQAPFSDSLQESITEDTPKEKNEMEGDLGDDEYGTGSADGGGVGAGGRLVLERARLRRKTSHHVPAPPLPSSSSASTSDGDQHQHHLPRTTPTAQNPHSLEPTRPPFLRRRTSHPPAASTSSYFPNSAKPPLPHLNLPSPPSKFTEPFGHQQRRPHRPGGPPLPAAGLNPNHASFLSSPVPSRGESGHGSSSSISPRNSPEPGSARSLNGSSTNGRDRFAGSLAGWNQPSSSHGLGLLHAQPRVLPRSFFGGSALDDSSEASASGSGGEGGGTASSGNEAGSGGSAGSGSGTPRSSHHHHSHRVRRFSQEEDDDTPIENLPDLSTPVAEHELEMVPEGETVVPSSGGLLRPPVKPVRRTSFPTKTIHLELDVSIRNLVSLEVFEKMLNDPVGRDRFREFIEKLGNKPSSLASLAFYCDSQAYRKFLEEFRSVGEALHETFLSSTSASTALANSPEADSSTAALNRQRKTIEASPFAPAARKALEELYSNEFGRFVRTKIVEQAKVRLGMFASQEERGDLGDVYCLTNPRLPDHPIVMCSTGFVRLTEYPRNQIVGRNCRFLQGPSTSREAVLAIRTALEAGKPCCEILLNYKRSGKPFLNCLSLIPLRSTTGRLEYYLSGQVDVTAALANSKTLAFLIGADQTLQQNAYESDRSHMFQESDLRLSSEVVESVERKIGHKSVFAKARSSGFNGGFRRSSALSSTSNGSSFASAGSTSRTNGGSTGGSFSGGSGMENGSTQGMSEVLKKLRGLGSGTGTGGESSSGGEGPTPIAEVPPGLSEGPMSGHTEIYTRIFVVRASKKLEIMFVTTPLLEALGYPFATPRQAYCSSLLHRDFTDLLVLPTKAGTAQLRDLVRSVVEKEISYSVKAGLAHSPNGRRRPGFRDEEGNRFSMGLIHLTPLRDAEGVVDCFVAVFGD